MVNHGSEINLLRNAFIIIESLVYIYVALYCKLIFMNKYVENSWKLHRHCPTLKKKEFNKSLYNMMKLLFIWPIGYYVTSYIRCPSSPWSVGVAHNCIMIDEWAWYCISYYIVCLYIVNSLEFANVWGLHVFIIVLEHFCI